MPDLVNHPPHYSSHPSGVECIQVVEYYNFCVGNAMKYLWRAGLKEGTDPIEDLKKAAWYVNREIERLSSGDLHRDRPRGKELRPRRMVTIPGAVDYLEAEAADAHGGTTAPQADGGHREGVQQAGDQRT
jgi:hypothetical protein